MQHFYHSMCNWKTILSSTFIWNDENVASLFGTLNGKGGSALFDSELRKNLNFWTRRTILRCATKWSVFFSNFSGMPFSLNHFGSVVILLLLLFIWIGCRRCIIGISVHCIINQIIFLIIVAIIIVVVVLITTSGLLATRWRVSQLSIWTTSGMICSRIMGKYRSTIIGRVFLSVKNKVKESWSAMNSMIFNLETPLLTWKYHY